MARTVFCEYLKQDAEGLDFQLYPGELGKRIFNSISKQAWGEWIKKQTMLVNEKKLNMMNAEHLCLQIRNSPFLLLIIYDVRHSSY